jgi:hypothetical protein
MQDREELVILITKSITIFKPLTARNSDSILVKEAYILHKGVPKISETYLAISPRKDRHLSQLPYDEHISILSSSSDLHPREPNDTNCRFQTGFVEETD